MLVEKTPKREALFWYKVNKLSGEDSCWLWTGAKNENGYGWITVTIDGKQRFFFTHKVSYEWEYGEIPKGVIVRHRCDTPLCVRPSHLLLGTHQDNTNDMMERGRYVSAVAKIDAATAVEIRHRRAEGQSAKDLSLEYNLTPQHISNICTGVYWPEAGGPITCRFEIPDSVIYSVISDVRRMTQAAAAVKNGISKAAVQQIASGKRLPRSLPSNDYQSDILKELEVVCR